jgi:sortase (surface protein transpeptidase)
VRPLSFSAPVEVAIPAICVRASVIPLGLNPDGTVRVPPLSRPRLTSWFDDGPAPGQAGPAALYGHVATAASGPAVFYGLGDLVPGDTVDVTRADHRVAVFVVYRVAEYPKSAFPTMTVYGDTPGPELRLITCGGVFDAAAGSYLDNIVVYARLTAVTAP